MGLEQIHGTFDYFTEAIIKKSKSFAVTLLHQKTTTFLCRALLVIKVAWVILASAYYVENKDKLGAVKVKNKEGKFVEPSLETVMDGSYNPLSRPIIYLP